MLVNVDNFGPERLINLLPYLLFPLPVRQLRQVPHEFRLLSRFDLKVLREE